ncbi:MAG: undecaprenyl-diphosphate phosphatase [Bacteroidales bacterium]|jgi:undecaprenyl-diphosphatase|nr:undecaprenyl-diphosphate phosphatase [Bacteroidales bacterium]
MTSIEAIILGMIQGLTEFLPVSSSGHLTIGQYFFGIKGAGNLTFDIVVHAATVLSIFVVFRKDIRDLAVGFFKPVMNSQKDYVFKIIISMIPVAIVGFFFKDYVEAVFGSGLAVVGVMLCATAAMLVIGSMLAARQVRKNMPEKKLGYKEAFIIGLAQSVAVMPGLSRSGTTISAGLMLGVKKEEVARFSFLMVIIPILGEAVLELFKGGMSEAASGVAGLQLFLGFVSAFVFGTFACKVMLNIVRRNKLYGFAIYCALAGSFCIAYSLF